MESEGAIKRSIIVGLLGALLGLGAFGGEGCRPVPPEQLLIRGGPSVEPLLAELARAYQATHPHLRIVSNFTCPPCRVVATHDMPIDFDLFVSLGDFELRSLQAHSSFIPEKTQPLGATRLVLVSSKRAAAPIRSVADLHKNNLRRIGLGDPQTVGVGYYARQALQKMGLWQELEPHFVFSQSGCELLQWLALGRDIDAAIVFALCLGKGSEAIQAIMPLPAEAAPPVPLLLAMPKQAPHPQLAQSFMAFATQAKDILQQHGVEPLEHSLETQKKAHQDKSQTQ